MPPTPDDPHPNTARMLLTWLHLAVPRILSNTTSQTLETVLSDGIVLADLVSYLDPIRLQPQNILRSTPRNALSTPLPNPHSTKSIDARHNNIIYETNTRRILYAIKKILHDVRVYTRSPSPLSGSLHNYVQDVSKIPPSIDPRPVTRLTEVIIACACHGPRHNEFRHAVWQMDNTTRATFMNSMNAVAAALSLPPANVLYTPTHTPKQHPLPSPQPIHSPLLSPRQQPYTPPHPFSPGIFSPPGHLRTPPIAATPAHQPSSNAQPFPYPLSPPLRAPVYQKPPLPMSPRATLAPQSVKSPLPESPRTPSLTTASPHRVAPVNSRSAYSNSRGLPKETGKKTRSSGRRSSSSSPGRHAAFPVKHTSNVTDDGVVTMSRSIAPDAAGTHLTDGNAPGQSYDDGLGLRKFSAVTQESASAGVSPVATGHIGNELDARVSNVQESTTVSDLVQRFDEGSNNSKRSSEEFYTPKETISPEQQSPPTPVERAVQERVPAQPSTARPPKYSNTQGEFSTGNVDEYVRQSVSDSVITQFNKPGSNKRDQGTTSATSSVYGPESYRSVDFSDPRFMQTPLDAPSPSNHWNMSHGKDHCEGIFSPQPLFTPPHMPQRLRKSTAATQMTPPIAQPQAPKLFRSGSVSSQYSFSSAGDNQDTAKQSVPSATGVSRDVGVDSVAQTATENVRTHEQVKGFSLPPSAGSEEEERKLVEDQETVPSAYDDDDDYGDDEQREVSQSGSNEDLPTSSPQGLRVYDDREYSEDHEDLSEGGEVPPQQQNSLPDEDISLSDKGTFEEVEEYAVYSSDHHTDDFFPPGEDEPQFVHEEVLCASSGEFDIVNDTEGQTDIPGQLGHMSVEQSEREIAGISQPDKEVRSQAVESEEIGDSRIRTERASEPTLTTSARPPRVTRPMSFSSPAYGAMYRRSVPPTPPSPPAIESLVRSFTDAKRLPESISTHPVSTMEPSAGLFQKLISVWQNADDDQRTELSQSQIVVEGLPSHPITSDPPASQSTQDSTLRDSQSQEASPSLSASRSRRPRAVRLPDGLKSPQHLSSSVTREDSKSPEGDKASIASFSDDFNSEDRNHAEAADVEWEEALRGREDASAPVDTSTTQKPILSPPDDLAPPSPSMVQRKAKSHSTSTTRTAPAPEDHLVKVDRRRLDWLTRQLLAARDAISRKDLQMTFAETDRADQREILLLEKQDAESVIDAMKKLLADREAELQTARNRLSVAIEGVARDRASQESRTSAGGDSQNFHNFVTEGHTKIHEHIDRSELKQMEAQKANGGEMKELMSDIQHLLTETMEEMTQQRDAELNALKTDLRNREQLVSELQKASAELMSQNREIQSEASQVRLEKERSDHRYKMEMSHVSAQVELVNEFSKKLHDNFRETENLRQQVLHYQDKLSQISSTSGVSRRQIKELREAVTRANDECARLRREAEAEKRKRMEAIRRAEELEDLRMKDDAAQSHGRYPDRMDRTDSGSFRSHEPVRPAGHNRPGGSGVNARYHARARGAPTSPTTAQRAWHAVKDKISGIVTGKDMGPSRRRGPGHNGRRDYSKGGGSSQSSHSQTRSRGSPRDEFGPRSRSGSIRSRSSQGSGSSARSGQRSNRSGGSGGRRTSPGEEAGQYMHTEPYGRDDIGRIRATDF